MASGCLAKVVFSDARHNFLLHGLAAVGVLLFTPVIFGLSGLNARMAAQPMEIVSAVIGTILMTPVFMPEQNENIRDVVCARKTSHILVCFLRLLLAAILAVLLTGVLALWMRHSGSEVSLRLFAGAAGNALALGSLGFFASAVGDNAVIGYMTAFSYFFADLFLREKLGVFDLFTFSQGKTAVNLWLYVTAAVLVSAALAFRRLSALRS